MLSKLFVASATLLLVGCGSLSHTNFSREEDDPLPPYRLKPTRDEIIRPVRATLEVNGKRGNPRVLFFLALSGGGSRAAYFSSAAMLKLQTLFDDVDLLNEVDVLSAVSGGSLAAAYYAISRDASVILEPTQEALPWWREETELQNKLLVADRRKVTCTGPLSDDARTELRDLMVERDVLAERLIALCDQ